MEDINKLKEEVVWGAKKAYEKGLVSAGEGNMSALLPEREELLITPTYNQYVNLKEENIVRLDFNGTNLSQNQDPSSEYRLHIALYRERSRAGCVVHTHSTFASMLSVTHKRLPVIFEEMLIFLGGEILVSDYGQANTAELAEKAVKVIGKKNAVILGNHGVLACGRNMEKALKTAELVEKMAHIYWGANQLGDIKTIPEEKRKLFLEKFEEKFATY